MVSSPGIATSTANRLPPPSTRSYSERRIAPKTFAYQSRLSCRFDKAIFRWCRTSRLYACRRALAEPAPPGFNFRQHDPMDTRCRRMIPATTVRALRQRQNSIEAPGSGDEAFLTASLTGGFLIAGEGAPRDQIVTNLP